MPRLLCVAAIWLTRCGILYAQTGEISGRVTDERGEGVPFVNVSAEQSGKLITGVQTDFDGYYALKLDPGTYDIKVSAINLNTKVIRGVIAYSNKIVGLDISTTEKVEEIKEVVVKYKKPIVAKDETAIVRTISAEEIDAAPATDINAIISTTAGIFQSDDGQELHFRGGRADAYEVYIDGIRVIGTYNVPINSIQELTTYTAGIPAKFGNATSGIIEIITKGPSRDFGGMIDLSTSQGMDAYGFNRGTANLTGPIVTINKGKDDERVGLGYFVAGEYYREQDPNPGIHGVYKTKDDTLKFLEENPLVPSPTGEGFIPRTETAAADDLENVKSKPNVALNVYTFSGKLESKPTKTITLTAGGDFIYSAGHSWVDRYTLFNYVNNPYFRNNTWRAYGRFRQRFPGKSSPDEDKGTRPPRTTIQNAYYQVQFDFTQVKNKTSDDSHGFKPFHYGYLGKFDILRRPTFEHGTDPVSGKTGWLQTGYEDTLVRFSPANVNPTGTAFTNSYYQQVGAAFIDGWWTAPFGGAQEGFYETLDQIQANAGGRGALNGDRQSLMHGIWFNTGRQFNGYSVLDQQQYALSVLGSADIVPGRKGGSKHGLEFGFEFEQRIQSNFNIAPLELWTQMRLLANRHIRNRDTQHPYLLIEGQVYSYDDTSAPPFGEQDTVLYNQFYNASQQSFFDKSVRRKLGLAENNTDFINIDAYEPDFYSLDMFSADELLNNGNPFVDYNGYDYTGKKLSRQPSFNDFFTQKDEFGNYTRPVGSFRPIYASAFIQDKFNFKDLLFNVGLRIDRYDANQKVLRDPYLLYPAYTVQEIAGTGQFEAPAGIPANIGPDYVVYVDDFNKIRPRIVGYRSGDTWYTADGVETNNAKVIALASADGSITPYLKNPDDDNDGIKRPDFNPDNSFKDYEPQITVMPRIAFSFNITETANFFAHYDILTQRPQGNNQTSPVDWYFFRENIGGFIPNPNLKPEKTIDYQVGFKQALTEIMAVTLSAYYREFRDMVQVRAISYAYPQDYRTFGNIDFGTVKGFSLAYELRRSPTSNLSLNANYTIEWAEGTGSSATSAANLVNANQPNLRTITPFDYDSRHKLNLEINYSYKDGDEYRGPLVKGKQILSNAGINLIARAWSGTPYTQQENPTADAVAGQATRKILSGSINGSRLPWSFKLDLKIWKEFLFDRQREKKDAEGNLISSKRLYKLSAYLQIRNLLNTANILRVYPYTGNADDDGYLTSALGQQDLNSQANPQSYYDLYRAYVNHPDNYTLPRSIRVGAILKF